MFQITGTHTRTKITLKLPPPEVRGLRVGLSIHLQIHLLCIRAAKALASMCICAGSPEFSWLENLIGTKLSCAGPFTFCIYIANAPLVPRNQF